MPLSVEDSDMDDDSGDGEAASTILLKEKLESVLRNLSARERSVLSVRFGLEDGRPRTIEEVGAIFGMSRDEVRAIEAAALRKLRHPEPPLDAA